MFNVNLKLTNHQTARHRRQYSGFTLIELMIALALGTVISGASVLLYLESKRSYAQDEEMARLQESARYALDFLKREISLSGFYAGIQDTSILAPNAVVTDCDAAGSNWVLDIDTPIELINNAMSGNPPTTSKGVTFDCLPVDNLMDGADIISIKRTLDAPTLDNGVLKKTVEKNQWYIKKFDYTDYAWSFLTASIPADEIGSGSTYDYWQYHAAIYYIRNYSLSEGDGIPTLCTASLEQSEMQQRCLVEGIEDIQIEFGIDTNNDSIVDQYKSAPSAADFNKTLSVRLYLLVRSINEVGNYTNKKHYRLGTKTISAFNDHYLRRVFSTTIKLRNIKLS